MIRTAEQLMQKNVIAISPTATLRELAELLDDEGVHGVPVVDAVGNPVGVVSRSDLVHAMNESEPRQRPVERYYGVHEEDIDWSDDDSGVRFQDTVEAEKQVAEIMSARILSTNLRATAGELSRTMLKFGVRRLLVLEGRRLVGIVSATDLLRCLSQYEKALAPVVRAPRRAAKVRTRAPAKKAAKR